MTIGPNGQNFQNSNSNNTPFYIDNVLQQQSHSI